MAARAITSVLVANRGEIAARIVRGLKAQSITAIAIFHAADRDGPVVKLADQAHEITGATPVAAYLDGAQIIARALATGADAIHPGYGFLSENAAFARAVMDAGLVFIGPPPDVITLMGDKINARAFAARHGCPVAPSVIEDDDPGRFLHEIVALGPPILIKPAAGGGGKGMRIVRDMAALPDQVDLARAEAQRYFGDGRLYAERYIESPRHIEVQILGDQHGNVVHLFERECSLQRRFQKIVEESPSPALTDRQRADICTAAARVAQAAHYVGAGTVEFIYGHDADGQSLFYFLEMNTRLQVEHPVTEAVIGLDLVAEQVRIAAGEKLGYAQHGIKTTGHAIEARIYAEDAARDFAPTTGKILQLCWPEGEGIRIDAGIASGQEVTPAFDPMLAKLIVHAPTRAQALQKICDALSRLVLLGCDTNIDFLRRLLQDEDVVAGRLHTGLIAQKNGLAVAPDLPAPIRVAALAAASVSLPPVVAAAHAILPLHRAIGAWRN